MCIGIEDCAILDRFKTEPTLYLYANNNSLNKEILGANDALIRC